MGFMDKFADIFKERPEDDFDDFYEDTSSDFDMPPRLSTEQQADPECKSSERGKNRTDTSLQGRFR